MPVTYDSKELMAMSTEMVCKKSAAKVGASQVTYVKENEDWGQTWKYAVDGTAVAGCEAIVFDPRMVPMGAGELVASDNSAGAAGEGGSTASKDTATAVDSAAVAVCAPHSGLLTMVAALVAAMIW